MYPYPQTFLDQNSDCIGCLYYDRGDPGDNSLEGYQEPEEPMCTQPNLMQAAEESEHAGIILNTLMFTLATYARCPFRRQKLPRSIKDSRSGKAYRAIDLNE